MAQSFDPTVLSLSVAADMVAVRVKLGVASRPAMTKEAFVFDINNPAHAAMLGGGIGAGGGLLATLMSKRKEKRWLRNTLLGGALGAGLGGAGSYLAKKAPGVFDTPQTKIFDQYKGDKKLLAEVASDGTMNGQPATNRMIRDLYERLAEAKRVLNPVLNPTESADTPNAARDSVGSARRRIIRGNIRNKEVFTAAENMAEWGAGDMSKSPVKSIGLPLVGGTAGLALDKLRADRYAKSPAGRYAAESRTPVTPGEIKQYEARMTRPVTAHEIRDKNVRVNLPQELSDRIVKADIVKPLVVPKMPPVRFPRGASSKVPPIPKPKSSPVTGNKDIFKDVDVQAYMPQLQSDVERIRRETAAKIQKIPKPLGSRTGRTGAFIRRNAGMGLGALAGAAANMFSGWSANPAEAARLPNP